MLSSLNRETTSFRPLLTNFPQCTELDHRLQNIAQVAVIIPTYNRGSAVLAVLEKIRDCDPKPAEIWVHVDLADGMLECDLHRLFPNVGVLTSSTRLGPGGGRHRCLLACGMPYAVSFDDDSYPVDSDFFSVVERLFSEHAHAAIFAARIWHRDEHARTRSKTLLRFPEFIGCGYAIRLAAYRQVRGYIARPVAYGLEESDLSLQLFAAGWHIYETGNLRVFHDTDLRHHRAPEITSGVIANVGLYAYLHYPVIGWGLGLAQIANKVAYCIRAGRLRGIWSGIRRIPAECYRHRHYRKPVGWRTLRRFLRFRRTGLPHYHASPARTAVSATAQTGERQRPGLKLFG
jgi:GT2 family glycosyltransferase